MWNRRFEDLASRVGGLGVVLAVVSLGLAPAGTDALAERAAGNRFGPPGTLVEGAAEWVTFEDYRGAFGSGSEITVIEAHDDVRLDFRLQLDSDVTGGVLVRDRLYLVERTPRGDRLSVLQIDSKAASPVPFELHPAPRGALHLARMDDYLLVAEDGLGLRILQLPHPHAGGFHHDGHQEPKPVTVFPFDEPVVAVAASLRTVFLATTDEVAVVDTLAPSLPGLARRIPLDAPVTAMAANGPFLYLLGDDGLRILDLSADDGSVVAELHSEIRGRELFLAGRTLFLADGTEGLTSVADTSSVAAVITVQVGDVFFNPTGLINVNVGDTVVWQKAGTVFPHNVFSCDGIFAPCGGATATETFTSGAVTTAPFNLSHVFTVVGSNPYLCQQHAFTMTGDINVNAAATPPPGVADGRSLTQPMTANRLDAPGADLRLFYDPAACGADADDHNVIFGTRSQLPTVPGGIYGLTGARCNIGLTSPFDWIASPMPAAGDFLWWIVVADDGGGAEGSWSEDSTSGERTGPGVGGASNLCGNTTKDLTNTCPP